MLTERQRSYNKAVGDRLKLLMDKVGLEITGFAAFIDKSESHVYSILKGRRALTNKTALDIGIKLGFDGTQIFKLDYRIPESVKSAKYLNNFKRKFKNNPEFFLDTAESRKRSYFVTNNLLANDFFKKPKYIKEVRNECLKLGKKYTSEELTKTLTYLVRKNKLKSSKQPQVLKNGKRGKRLINVYYNNSN